MNIIWGYSTTLAVIVGSVKLRLKFLFAKVPFDLVTTLTLGS